MIRVTVELISAVHPSRNVVLGVAVIANDGQGTLLSDVAQFAVEAAVARPRRKAA